MEHQEQVRHLVDDAGLSYTEAVRRLENGDLWVLDPEMRYAAAAPTEEAYELEWAAYFYRDMAESAR